MDLPLLGRGRAADVYDLGDGRVLRRYRVARPGVVEREAAAMRALRAAGAPVPEVFDASGADIVMARVSGRSLLDLLKARPWRARAIGRRLGELHRALLSVHLPAGLDLPRVADGDTLLHLDFHPDNILVDGTDAVIIDWSNAGYGPAGLDVATSWMLMSIGSPDGVPRLLRPFLTRVRASLVAAYCQAAGTDDAIPWVALACERRLADPSTRPEEIERVHVFAARYSAAATG